MYAQLLIGASLLGSAFSHPSKLEARAVVPSTNGFPTPSAQQLISIQQQAHGSLSNAPPPAPGALNNDTLTSLQLIAFNELFETAFFNSLLNNITSNVTGYTINDTSTRSYIITSLTAIIAQEQLHALNAQNALASQNVTRIQPCTNYIFPTTTFESAIVLAQTFTDVVLGTLQDVIRKAAAAGVIALTGSVGSVIGQEGEQVGYFRSLQKKIPSAQPFLTAGSRAYAWTALQGFAAPGSCPSTPSVALPIFAPLTVLGTPSINTTSLQFSFNVSKIASAKLPRPVSWTSTTNFSQVASVVYINGQNLPLSVPIKNSSVSGQVVTVSADFPFQNNLLYALTLAAIVSGTGNFSSVDAAVNATVFAPGLIEIQ